MLKHISKAYVNLSITLPFLFENTLKRDVTTDGGSSGIVWIEFWWENRFIGIIFINCSIETEKYGPNKLKEEEKQSLFELVLEQFDDLLVKILLGAAVLSFGLAFFEEGAEEGIQAFVEPIVILTILILNAIVGVWQESNAANALDALKKLQPKNTVCWRDGKMIQNFPAENLVPGDVIQVVTGDQIPADCRVLKLLNSNFRADESTLTGESKTILKHSDPLNRSDYNGKRVGTAEKKNMVFSGTAVGTYLLIRAYQFEREAREFNYITHLLIHSLTHSHQLILHTHTQHIQHKHQVPVRHFLLSSLLDRTRR